LLGEIHPPPLSLITDSEETTADLKIAQTSHNEHHEHHEHHKSKIVTATHRRIQIVNSTTPICLDVETGSGNIPHDTRWPFHAPGIFVEKKTNLQ